MNKLKMRILYAQHPLTVALDRTPLFNRSQSVHNRCCLTPASCPAGKNFLLYLRSTSLCWFCFVLFLQLSFSALQGMFVLPFSRSLFTPFYLVMTSLSPQSYKTMAIRLLKAKRAFLNYPNPVSLFSFKHCVGHLN